MVINTLKKTQLIAIRDSIFTCINTSSVRRASLVTSGAMNPSESLKIAEYEDSLRKLADDLNFGILNAVIADIQNPVEKIITSTNKVNKAIKELKALNDFIGILAAVISMASTIVVAFNTANLLKLADILYQIEVIAD